MFFLFDLDGVLVDFCNIHKEAFLEAWNSIYPTYPIHQLFHQIHLEARPTKKKIEIVREFFDIHDLNSDKVFQLKQELTTKKIESANVYQATKRMITWAIEQGHTLACCSNSIRSTVEASLLKLTDTLSTFKLILSNEDVQHPKPAPDIYKLAMERLGPEATPQNTIVFEDSYIGQQAARDAGLQVFPVIDACDLTTNLLSLAIKNSQRPLPKTLQLVIPMGGLGSRFQKSGYSTPKPFLPVCGIPMYQWVIRNIVPESLLPITQIHIIVREEHMSKFEEFSTDSSIQYHTVPTLTEGAACTVLSIKDFINNDSPLVIANSDQFLDWNPEQFYSCLVHPDFDGVISTFLQNDTTDLRWSYAKINDQQHVSEVQEKKWISPEATTGIYGWKRGSDFIRDTESMISKNIRVNNEFYVCPVYNESILRGLQIRTNHCNRMWGLGTPSDYEYFLQNWKPLK